MKFISKRVAELKVVVCLSLILRYWYSLESEIKNPGWSNDDVIIRWALLSSAILAGEFLFEFFGQFVLFRACRKSLVTYGWLRVLLYLISVGLLAFLFVGVADKITVSSWSTISDEVLNRFEDNIVSVKEDRNEFSHTMIHPFTKGKENPVIFQQLFRYPMEDVQMKCSTRIAWISGGTLHDNQIIWHLNGVPVEFSDRHSMQVHLRELPEKDQRLAQILAENGISVYDINATLTIQLLKESEFGSYTCHIAKAVKASIVDHASKTYMAKQANQTHESVKDAEPDRKKQKDAEKEYCKCTHDPELRYLFQDMYTWKAEFRLIPVPKQQKILVLPPASILSFQTRYWHLSRSDEVEIEYTVNEESFLELCPGVFHGCSKLLLIYWLTEHKIGESFGIPPLELFTIWTKPSFPAKEFQQVHCLCENSYGYHSVRYQRRYHNRTTRQYQIIEITHPQELIVVPREQDLLNVFQNRSTVQYQPDFFAKPTVPTPRKCRSASSLDNISLVKAFAVTAVNYFHWSELSFFAFAALVGLIFLWNMRKFLRAAGRLVRRFVLDGSFAFLPTAVISARRIQREVVAAGPHSRWRVPYDVFLSHSDAEGDVRIVTEEVTPFLEEQGFRVCLRDRDLPPNLLELPSLSQAIKRTKKIIFFLSRSYFEERFSRDFEAAIILETLCDRPAEPDKILLVKLDACEIPSWLSQFPVHDWSGNLTGRENCRKLLRWLLLQHRKGLWLSAFDAFITLLPMLFTCASLFACSCLSWFF